MFEEIFNGSNVAKRHLRAPFPSERESFLRGLANEGYARGTLAAYSERLLKVIQVLGGDTQLTEEDIARAARESTTSAGRRRSFKRVALLWYGFRGLLRVPEPVASASSEIVADFRSWLSQERGLAKRTVDDYCSHAERFLEWCSANGHGLREFSVEVVDHHIADFGKTGVSRRGIAGRVNVLRALIRHAFRRGWCSSSIADAVERPRIYDLEALPMGPSWQDVGAMVSACDTGSGKDLRDRAILLLFTIYGWRVSEVAGLRLYDIDWQNERITIRRPKRRSVQSYPLVSVVGNAIYRYLQECRVRCHHRELFLTVSVPIRPMTRSALYEVVRKRLDSLKIESRRRGPHALRHACAIHLLDEGLSLKEIGDHLGHQSPSSTRVYAKVNLLALREVADFDLGGVL